MDLSVSNYLGALQGDPYSDQALEGLQKALRKAKPKSDEVKLLRAATALHLERGEWWAAAGIIEILAMISGGKGTEEKVALWNQLAELRSERLLDAEGALEAYEHALKVSPKHGNTRQAREELRKLSRQWQTLVSQKQRQAESVTDDGERGRLFTEIAALLQKFEGNQTEAERYFQQAITLNARDKQAILLYANLLRQQERWEDLVSLWLAAAESSRRNEERALFFEHAARLLAEKLNQSERAVACYERVIVHRPGDREAMAYLAQWFTEHEAWDNLVDLYEHALRSGARRQDEEGALLQVGMIHWRKRGAVADAEPYFARLRKMEPAHPAVLEFYETTLSALADQPRLLVILHDAQRAADRPEERLALALKIAQVAGNSSATLERSIDAWKLVLQLDPGNDQAVPALKSVYNRLERWSALAEHLKGELDLVPREDTVKQLGILRELLVVYRDRLQSDVMVANVYNSILQIEPHDEEALRGLADAYQRMGRYRDLIPVLHVQADVTTDLIQRITYLKEIAALWIEHGANLNQAAAVLQQVLEILPTDDEAQSRLREIYVKKRAWKELYALIEARAHATTHQTARLALLRELADIAASKLVNRLQALGLWKQVLKEDTAALDALDAIERLAEQEQDWQSLVEVLERRVATVGTDIAAVPILERLGVVYSEQLRRAEKALETWQRLLGIDSNNRRALRAVRQTLQDSHDWDALEAFYASKEDWEGLVDALGTAADRMPDAATKVELSLRAARVYETKLTAPHRAFRSYERILSVEADNEAAARALVPIYEKEEKWNRLVGVLRILLKKTKEQGALDAQVELLRKLAILCLDRLRDGELSFVHALEAFRLAPSDHSLREILEQAADLSQQQPKLAEAYEWALSEVTAAAERVELHRRLAQLWVGALAAPSRAVSHFFAVLEFEPSDAEALDALERIFQNESNYPELKAILLRKIAAELNPHKTVEWLRELARLEEEKLSEREVAAAHYREILALDPADLPALLALERLASQDERWQELADLLARHLELSEDDGERFDLAMKRGDLLQKQLSLPNDALGAYQQALDLRPLDERALDTLDELASAYPKLSPDIDPALEGAYESLGQLDRLARTLERSLAYTSDKHNVRLRIAELKSAQDDVQGLFQALGAAFLEAPESEELLPQLEGAARASHQESALVGIYEEALARGTMEESYAAALYAKLALLYEQVLHAPERAEACNLKVLEIQPSNSQAYEALRSYYSAEEQWLKLQKLYESRASAAIDVEEKISVLLQVSFLHEEILDAPKEAVLAYEAVLELEPEHARASRALEQLYVRTENWHGIVRLLERALERAEGQDAVDIQYRLGELYESHIGDAQVAVDYFLSALEQQPTHLRAQEALERLMTNVSERARVAGILEPIYESQGAYAELARVLYVQLEDLSDTPSRVGMLQRIAAIEETKTRDACAAFDTYVKAFMEDPSDVHLREELSRLAEATGRDHDYSHALRNALSNTRETPALTKELLYELAKFFDHREQQPGEAEKAYAELIAADPHDPEFVLPASRALMVQHRAQSNFSAWAEDLERIAELTHDPSERQDALFELAALYENALENKSGAISAFQKLAEADPSDMAVLEGWARMLEADGQWERLVDVLAMQIESGSDDVRSRHAQEKIARVYEEKLLNIPQAISAYEALIEQFQPEHDVLIKLARLYEADQRWADVLEIFWTLKEHFAQEDDQISLRLRAAFVLGEKLNDHVRAVELYREVLAIDPDHEPTIEALHKITEGEDASARLSAARALADLYDAKGRHRHRVDALRIVAQSEDKAEAFNALQDAARAALRQLDSPREAFELWARAVKLAPEEHDIRETLLELLSVAGAADAWDALLGLLKDLAPTILDEELNLYVLRTAADIARIRLKDGVTAREYYRVILERVADDAAALDALEELEAECGNAQGLLSVLRQKTDLATTSVARVHLLLRQADIAETDLGNVTLAIEAYEQVMQEGARAEAFDPLERLYRQAERWVDLGFLYERALELGLGDCEETRFKLGRIFIDHRDAPEEGMEHLRRLLEENPDHEDSINYLESLVLENKHVGLAAPVLEPLLLVKLDWDRLIRIMRAHCEFETESDEKMRLLGRLAETYEDHLEDLDGALLTYARMFEIDPSNHQAREALVRLARVLEQWETLALAYEEALDHLTDPDLIMDLALSAAELRITHHLPMDKVVSLLRRVLSIDSTHEEAFELLEQELLRSESYALVAELYESRIQVVFDEATQIELLHRRARIYRDHLNDPGRAIEIYRRILEIDPLDAPAARALDDTLVNAEKWIELADFLASQADRLMGTDVEPQLRHRVAHLYLEQLSDVEHGLRILEEMVDANPHHSAAVESLETLVQQVPLRLRVARILERVYEATDQWMKLIAIYQARAEMSTDIDEQIELHRLAAVLHEERGHNPRLAMHAWSTAFVLDPSQESIRYELERLADAGNLWRELALALEDASVRIDDTSHRRGLLEAASKLYDARLNDVASAIRVYEQLLELGPQEGNETVLRRLRELYRVEGNAERLVQVGQRLATMTTDPHLKHELWLEVAVTYESDLGRDDDAIAAYEHAAAVVPAEGAGAWEGLDRLYTKHERYRALADVLLSRVGMESDLDKRSALRLRLGDVQFYELSEPQPAIDTYLGILGDNPSHQEALERLALVYQSEGRWSEYAETVERRITLESESSVLARLHVRVAEVCRNEVEDVERAFAHYAAALEADATFEPVIEGLVGLAEQPSVRSRVLATVMPLLKSQGRWDELARLLEIEADHASSDVERHRRFAELSVLHDQKRRNIPDAQHARGLALLSATEDAIPLESERLEGLATQTTDWQQVIDIYDARLTRGLGASAEELLYLRTADVAENRLGNMALAISALSAAWEKDKTRTACLPELQRLLMQSERWPEAHAIILEQLKRATSDSDRLTFLEMLGDLEHHRLADAQEALRHYREILDMEPRHQQATREIEALLHDPAVREMASDALEQAYTQQGKPLELAALFEQRLLETTDREQRLRLIARTSSLWEGELHDVPRALEFARQGFALDQGDDWFKRFARLLDQNAAQLGEAGQADEAADLCIELGSLYEARDDFQRAADEYERAIALSSARPDSHDMLARVYERAGNTPALIATLERSVRLLAPKDAAAVFVRISGLYREASLGEQGMMAALIRARELAPDDQAIWSQLRALFEQTADHQAMLEQLLFEEQRLSDPAAKLERLQAAGQIALVQLKDSPQAVVCFQRALLLAPGDRTILLALCDAHADQQEYDKVIEVLKSIIASFGTTRSKEVATFHHEIGKAYWAQKDMERAREHFDAAFKLDLGNVEILKDYGLFCLEQNDLEGAQKKFRALLLQRLDKVSGMSKADVYFYLGQIAVRQKDTAKAKNLFERALAEDSAHAGALRSIDEMR